MMSRSADQLRRRWSGVAKRGSAASSGRPSSGLQARPQRGGPAGLERECRPPTAKHPHAGRGAPCASPPFSTAA